MKRTNDTEPCITISYGNNSIQYYEMVLIVTGLIKLKAKRCFCRKQTSTKTLHNQGISGEPQ